MKRKKAKTDCRECGEKGTYYYSRALAKFLGLGMWEGVYLCNKCLKELEARYRIQQEGREDDSIYSMLV